MPTQLRTIWNLADDAAKAVADATIGTIIVLIQSARASREAGRKRRPVQIARTHAE
jgi:hypothetical protein